MKAAPAILFAALPFFFFLQVYPNYTNTNELSRLLLVSAIVDDHSFQIDRAIARYGDTQDKSFYEGHYYSNKAIGYSLLAVPFYYMMQPAGRFSGDTVIWALRFFVNVLPLLFFSIALYRFFYSRIPSYAGLLLVAFLYGSLVFPFAQLFMSHLLVGLFWFAGFLLLQYPTWKRSGAAGLLLGFTFVMEIPSAITIFLFVLYVAWQRRPYLPTFLSAVVMSALPSLLYNYFVFDGFFSWSYQHLTDEELKAAVAGGYVGVSWPSLRVLWELTLGSNRGVFYYMPHCLFGLVGLLRATSWKSERILVAAIIFSNILFYSAFSYWSGGWSLGPRFLVPLVPFLIYASALWMEASFASPLRYVYLFLLGWTITNLFLGTATYPFLPQFLDHPLIKESWILFWHGAFGLNAGELLGIPAIALVSFGLLLVALVLLLRMSKVPASLQVLLLVAVAATFLISGFGSQRLKKSVDAMHCLSIGRIAYIAGHYPVAEEFLRYSMERTTNPMIDAEAKRWLDSARAKRMMSVRK